MVKRISLILLSIIVAFSIFSCEEEDVCNIPRYIAKDFETFFSDLYVVNNGGDHLYKECLDFDEKKVIVPGLQSEDFQLGMIEASPYWYIYAYNSKEKPEDKKQNVYITVDNIADSFYAYTKSVGLDVIDGTAYEETFNTWYVDVNSVRVTIELNSFRRARSQG